MAGASGEATGPEHLSSHAGPGEPPPPAVRLCRISRTVAPRGCDSTRWPGVSESFRNPTLKAQRSLLAGVRSQDSLCSLKLFWELLLCLGSLVTGLCTF